MSQGEDATNDVSPQNSAGPVMIEAQSSENQPPSVIKVAKIEVPATGGTDSRASANAGPPAGPNPAPPGSPGGAVASANPPPKAGPSALASTPKPTTKILDDSTTNTSPEKKHDPSTLVTSEKIGQAAQKEKAEEVAKETAANNAKGEPSTPQTAGSDGGSAPAPAALAPPTANAGGVAPSTGEAQTPQAPQVPAASGGPSLASPSTNGRIKPADGPGAGQDGASAASAASANVVFPPTASAKIAFPPTATATLLTPLPPTVSLGVEPQPQLTGDTKDIGDGIVVVTNSTLGSQTLAIDSTNAKLISSKPFQPPQGWASIADVCVFGAAIFLPVVGLVVWRYLRRSVSRETTVRGKVSAGCSLAGSVVRNAFMNATRLRHCRGEDLENLGSEGALYLALHRETAILILVMTALGCSVILPIHLGAGENAVSLEFTRSTIQHLAKHSPLLWVHTGFVFLFSWVYYRYVSKCRAHVEWAWKHGVIGARSVDMWDASVFVKSKLPAELNDAEVRRLLDELYPGQVSNVILIMDTSEAAELERKRHQVESEVATLRRFASFSNPRCKSRDSDANTDGSSPAGEDDMALDLDPDLDGEVPSPASRSTSSARTAPPLGRTFSKSSFETTPPQWAGDSMDDSQHGPTGCDSSQADGASIKSREVALLDDKEEELKRIRALEASLRTRHAGKCIITFASVDLAPRFADPDERRKAIRAAIERKLTWVLRRDAAGPEECLETASANDEQGMDSGEDEQGTDQFVRTTWDVLDGSKAGAKGSRNHSKLMRSYSAAERAASAAVLQGDLDAANIKDWDVVPSPDPHDIIWESLHLDPKMYWIRTVLANLLIAVVLAVLTTPTTILSLVSHMNSADEGEGDSATSMVDADIEGVWVAAVERIRELHPSLASFLFVFLPQIVILLVNNALMFTIYIISKYWEPHHTYSAQETSVLQKTFWFLLFNTLLVPALAFKSLRGIVGDLISSDASPFALLGQVFVVTSGAFTLTYVIAQTLVGSAFQLLSLPALFWRFAVRFLWPWATPEDRLRAQEAKLTFDFGSEYAVFLSVLSLVVMFSTTVPVILPFGLVYFCVKICVDQYQLNFECGREKSHSVPRCRIGRAAVRYLPVPLLLYQIAIIGYFSSYICLPNEIVAVASGRNPRGCSMVSPDDPDTAIPGTQVIRGTALQLLLLYAVFVYTASDCVYVFMIDSFNDQGMIVGAGFADQPFASDKERRQNSQRATQLGRASSSMDVAGAAARSFLAQAWLAAKSWAAWAQTGSRPGYAGVWTDGAPEPMSSVDAGESDVEWAAREAGLGTRGSEARNPAAAQGGESDQGPADSAAGGRWGAFRDPGTSLDGAGYDSSVDADSDAPLVEGEARLEGPAGFNDCDVDL